MKLGYIFGAILLSVALAGCNIDKELSNATFKGDCLIKGGKLSAPEGTSEWKCDLPDGTSFTKTDK